MKTELFERTDISTGTTMYVAHTTICCPKCHELIQFVVEQNSPLTKYTHSEIKYLQHKIKHLELEVLALIGRSV